MAAHMIRLLRTDTSFWLVLAAFVLLLVFLLIFRRLWTVRTEQETAQEGEGFLRAEPQITRPAQLHRKEAAPKHTGFAGRAEFLLENGDFLSFSLSAREMQSLPAEGAEGLLCTQGERFVSFETTQHAFSDKGDDSHEY